MDIYGHGSTKFRLGHELEAGVARPRTLLVKNLSMRQWREWQRKVDAARALQEGGQAAVDKALEECLAEVVTGWENIDGDFSIAAIPDKFSLGEFQLLLSGIPYVVGVTLEEKMIRVACLVCTGELTEAQLKANRRLGLPCTVCNRRNPEECAACGRTGEFEIPEPALKFVSNEVWELLDAARATRETGVWPGGKSYLDETPACYAGILRAWSELDEIEADLIKRMLKK